MNRSHFPTLPFILLLTLCTALTSCGQKEQTPIAEHVILIGLDGWGSYSLPEADMPAVKHLWRTEPTHSRNARSCRPPAQ